MTRQQVGWYDGSRVHQIEVRKPGAPVPKHLAHTAGWVAVFVETAPADADEPEVDEYGNPTSGDSLPYCCFPDCGCDGARLCQAKSGASASAMGMNIERGSWP